MFVNAREGESFEELYRRFKRGLEASGILREYRRKQRFKPADPNRVTMYVCGPTVYDRAHLGNARPVVVFDVLNRLLRHVYGADHVTYVRNFTDVDDKINAEALRRQKAGAPGTLEDLIHERTEETIAWYHADMDALGALRPTIEPRATEFIPQMVAMIAGLDIPRIQLNGSLLDAIALPSLPSGAWGAFVLALAPGDPFEELATNPAIPPEVRQNLRTQFGLDDPVYVRYLRWLVNPIVEQQNNANAAFAAGRRFESATEGLSDETFEVTK